MSASDGTVLGLVKVHDGGPPSSRWNLVIVSDGYQASQITTFQTRVEELRSTLFDLAPFNEPAVACAINIYRLEVASNDSGADDPVCAADPTNNGTGATANTYFDSTFCFDGKIRRGLSGDTGLTKSTVAAALPEYDAIIVLVNSTVRGGMARDGVGWFSTGSNDWKEVAIHEMGHSVFGLADEYDYYANPGGVEASQDTAPSGEPGQPNVTAEPDPAVVKWSALVTAGAASPTMANANCTLPNNAASPVAAGIVGTFEGANTYHCGNYRPEYACMMRSTGDAFCAVCSQTIRDFYATFNAPSPGTSISLDTPTLDFGDVPVDTTMLRAATFSVESCVPVAFQVTTAPTSPFAVQGSPVVTSNPEGGPTRKARLFFSLSGGAIGSSHTDTATIRCLETNEDFEVTLIGDFIARPTAAVQLVLDQSGSMQDPVPGIGDKASLLRFSANVLIDLLYADSGIGINAFDQDPHPMMSVQVAGPSGIGSGRLAARNALASYAPNPQGLTAIGDGIELGKAVLDASPPFDAKAMIVLTDGIETASKRVSEVAAGVIGTQVFAIGLGTSEDIQPATLQALTNNSGGYLLMTGPVDESRAFLLAKYYLQILAGVTNNDIVVDPDGTVVSGQVIRIPFDVTDEDIEITAVVLAPVPQALLLGLEAPDGHVFSQADVATNPQMDFSFGASSVHMRSSLPMAHDGTPVHAGRWHLLLALGRRGRAGALAVNQSAFAAQGAEMRYSASVYAYSNLRLRARLTQTGLKPGASCTIAATLTQSSIPIEGTPTVTAEITRPDGSMFVRTLSSTGAGRWETSFPAAQAGVYRCSVLAKGRTVRGQKFSREQIVTAAVWIGGNNPDGQGPGGRGDPADPTGGNGDPHGDCRCCNGSDILGELLCCLIGNRGLHPEALKRLEEWGIDGKRLLMCAERVCKKVGKD
jgi:hypothetical protein